MEPLLTPALRELGLPHRMLKPGVASVHDGCHRFEVVHRVQRHFLMRIEVAELRVPLLLRGGPGTISLVPAGRRSPHPFAARATPRTDELAAMGAWLVAERALSDALAPLDAKRLELGIGPESSTAVIHNVGLSRVVMAFPPTRKYIAAGPQQVAALRTAVRCLAELAQPS